MQTYKTTSMPNKQIPFFKSGVHNLLDPEVIPNDAALDALNFITQDGKTVLAGGRKSLGAEGAAGSITGFWKGYKVDGTTVLYAKFGTIVKYYDGSAWQNAITGLGENTEVTFSNYSSLAGAFTYMNCADGYYKFINANPGSPIDIYNSSKNFKGFITIDRSRTLLWNREKDKTGLYGSYIDRQDSTVYTTVSAEAIGSSGSTTYTGTLAFKAGNARRSCHAVTFTATVGAGAELFSELGMGVLTSNFGGTGTINYATGVYSVTFSAVTTGSVTATYQWEDSSIKGIADFSKSSTRLASEGFVFPQDEGGDAILNVLIGQDGNYYSMKSHSAYTLSLDADDLGATNEVYRKDMGLPFFRAAISTNKGIFFINTSNPTKPEMTILVRNTATLAVEPVVLFPQFKFSNYDFSNASFASYDRWVMVFCKTLDADNNNRILMCNMKDKTVDIVGYAGKMAVQDGQHLYIGSSVSKSVYEIFSGFDDMDLPLESYWQGKEFVLYEDALSKVRRLRFKGSIDPDQAVEVYINTDETGYQLVGTIRGNASYVNYADSQAIGANYIGETQIGGDSTSSIYKYFMEMKIRTGKFRKIGIQLIPLNVGYFDFDSYELWDILTFENRMPRGNRQKQRVSINGSSTNQ